jgi:ATP-dependent RNA helicase DDX56/DBP9
LRNQPNVLIGTVKQVLEGVQSKKISLKKVEIMVVDEADLIINTSLEGLKSLKNTYLPRAYQCIMTSATISEECSEKEKFLLNNPKIITDSRKISRLLQYYIKTNSTPNRILQTIYLIQNTFANGKILIFCKNKPIASTISMILQRIEVLSVLILDTFPVLTRVDIIKQFNKGEFNILISTDYGFIDGSKNDEFYNISRGIDFEKLAAVINYEVPTNPEVYTHRIGKIKNKKKEDLREVKWWGLL